MGVRILVAVDNDLVNDSRVTREIDVLIKNGFEVCTLCYELENSNSPIIGTYNTIRIQLDKKQQKRLLPLENRFGLFSKFWKRALVNAIRKFKPHFIIAHDLYMAKPARKAIDEVDSGIPLVLDLHENYPFAVLTYSFLKNKLKRLLTYPEKWEKKEGKHLAFADKIMVLDQSFGLSLQEKHPILKQKTFITYPNFPDLKRFSSYPINDVDLNGLKGPFMFYFGVIAERRGIFDALSAFKQVIASGNQLDFIMIGPVDSGDKELFHKTISDPMIKDHILYKKWIDVSELPSYLNAIDFCIAPFEVNPQHESGIANKIFQYLFGKKPILASNCKPQANFILGAKAGLIYKTAKELEDHMKTMASNQVELKKMGMRGYESLIKELNTPDYEENFVKLFKMENNHSD